MMVAVRPEPRDRVVVRNGSPWRDGAKETKVGALGVVLHRGPLVGNADSVFECWILVDGDGCPTILLSNQFDILPCTASPDKVYWPLVLKWIEKFSKA